MTDYQPTDEQIEMLAKGSATDDEWAAIPEYAKTLYRKWRREDFDKPSFQSIIRAAQAEAWDEGNQFVVDTCDAIWVNEWALGENPYREAADV